MKTAMKTKATDLKCNSNTKLCEQCGQPISKPVLINEKEYMVPVQCKCRKDKLEKEMIKEQLAYKNEKLRNFFFSSLEDRGLKQYTFDNWDHGNANGKLYSLVDGYCRNYKAMLQDGKGLYIHGRTGNGKTYAASCIAHDLRMKDVTVLFITAVDLISRIKQTFDKDIKDNEDLLIRSLGYADFLIIDDLGRENVSEWSKSIIFQIVDNRVRKKLPLIITSNLDEEELQKLYGQAISERILYQVCFPIHNSYCSIRKSQGKKGFQEVKELIQIKKE